MQKDRPLVEKHGIDLQDVQSDVYRIADGLVRPEGMVVSALHYLDY